MDFTHCVELGVTIGGEPLFVSSMDVLREQGIFGNAWLYPWDLDLGRVQFAMFRGVRRWS